jgi:hypothetical protein
MESAHPAEGPERRMFRRSGWKWLLAGAICILAASLYAGTASFELIRQAIGQRTAAAVWYALALCGGLMVLVAGLLLTEHVIIDEAAVELFRWGRPRLRMLWINVERVTLYKSPKRIRGPVELWGGGRSLRVDPGLMKFDELEAVILAKAAQLGVEVRNLREPIGG